MGVSDAVFGESRMAQDEEMQDLEENGGGGRHRSKERRRERKDERDHGGRDRERSKERVREDYASRDSDRNDRWEEGSRERRREESSELGKPREHEKERRRDGGSSRDKAAEKDYDRDGRYREKERESREVDRGADGERNRGREHGKDRERERDKEKERERARGHGRDKDRDRERGSRMHGRDDRVSSEKERDHEKLKDRESGREKGREPERAVKYGDRETEKDRDRSREEKMEKDRSKNREEKERERERERDKQPREKSRGKSKEREVDRNLDKELDKLREKDRKDGMDPAKEFENDALVNVGVAPGKESESSSASELKQRLARIKEERLKGKPDDASEILSWVGKSRKLEEKRNAEKEKARRLSRALEEQDNMLAESDEEASGDHGDHLAGVKILHGLDKVIEGGAVVLTLKDQNILAGGDVNEEIDALENVEIGEQKQRDEAYRAAKKKTGIYDDKFSDDAGFRRPILPQYDDPIEDEGVTLDEGGHFSAEAEKKLEELRRRIEGGSTQKVSEDLTSSAKVSSDYYTPDEMLRFKAPKKKKSLRKKEKMDLDALEAEAIASGLGAGDLGSRNDSRRQAAREEQERAEAERRTSAYQAAIAKAEEASKVLRQEQTLTVKSGEEDDLVFGEDYEDLQRSLEQARKLALKKQDETAGPQAVALLATSSKVQEDSSLIEGETQENKVIITEMEEFVWGLQLNEEARKPETEDVFMDEDDAPKLAEKETKVEGSERAEVEENKNIEPSTDEENTDVAPDEIIHEVAVGKGLAGALKLLKERGTLNEGIEWGGRTMDKKKSKLVGIVDDNGAKEIRIERTDEFGRIMTPKEAFRMLSHKFHGKGPGKMKQEKRMKKYQEDLKTKQMKASDTPLLAMEKMREAQARMKTPYLVLSGHVKPGQTSDPRSGFATVEKDHLGSLTPMLGDKKVEHFLGIKRDAQPGSMGPPPPKKPKI